MIFLCSISVLLLFLLYASSHLFLFHSNSTKDKKLSLFMKLFVITMVCYTCACVVVTRKFRNIYKILICEDKNAEKLLKIYQTYSAAFL